MSVGAFRFCISPNVDSGDINTKQSITNLHIQPTPELILPKKSHLNECAGMIGIQDKHRKNTLSAECVIYVRYVSL